MPVIPCASVVINVYLMLELDAGTWARFAIWMVLGRCRLCVSLWHCVITSHAVVCIDDGCLHTKEAPKCTFVTHWPHVFFFLGFLVYFLYGIRNSVNSPKNKGDSDAKNEVTKF